MIKVLDLEVVNGEKVRKEAWGNMLLDPLWGIVTATAWDERLRDEKTGKQFVIWRVSISGNTLKIDYESRDAAVKVFTKKDTRKLAELVKKKFKKIPSTWLQGRQLLTGELMDTWGYPWCVTITEYPESELQGKFGVKWGKWKSWKRKTPIVFDSREEAKKWFEEKWEWVFDLNVKKWHKDRGIEE